GSVAPERRSRREISRDDEAGNGVRPCRTTGTPPDRLSPTACSDVRTPSARFPQRRRSAHPEPLGAPGRWGPPKCDQSGKPKNAVWAPTREEPPGNGTQQLGGRTYARDAVDRRNVAVLGDN